MRSLLLTLLLPGIATAGEFHRLYAEEASASSFLKSNWNKYEENYHPSYVLDDDPKTAWVEGAEGDEIGESLTIPVSDQGSLKPKLVPGMEDEEGSEYEVLSNLLLLEGSATDPKKVFFTYKQVFNERSSSTTTMQGVALISEGKLQRLVTLETDPGNGDEGPEVAVSVMLPTYSEGKVSQLVTTRLEDREPLYAPSEDSPGIEMRKETLVPPLRGS